MITITQDFLDCCPNWAAAGWKVGDVITISKLSPQAIQAIDQHPLPRPGG